MNKKGLQMSFQWIFAIVVGAIILVLAIYGVTKFMNLEQGKQDVQKAQQLETLLNPLETSFETGKSVLLSTNVKTRIYNDCNSFGDFGEQKLGIQQENFGETANMKNSITSKNRYIFSDEYVEGNNFYIFSKPLNFPFKVSDLVYLSSQDSFYCFENTPDDVGKELSSLNQSNIIVDNCSEETLESEETIEVCFEGGNIETGSDCDVNVDYNAGTIEKSEEEVYFYNDALMYAGIFSDPENYECQLERLMDRTEKLADVYVEKSNIIASNCENSMKPGLLALQNFAKKYNQSSDLSQASQIVNRLEDQNEASWECRLW